MLRFKEGVSITFTAQNQAICDAGEKIYQQHGYACVVTAGSDGTHLPTSFHYQHRALDLRTRQIARADLPIIQRELQDELGQDYQVLIESDHFHIEHDPTT